MMEVGGRVSSPSPVPLRVGDGRAAPSAGTRDLFPLPRVAAPRRPDGRGGRRLAKWRLRRRESELVDSAHQALNWMHGSALGHEVQSEPDEMQQDAVDVATDLY